MLNEHTLFILTEENKPGYYYEQIDEKFIEQNITDFNKHFYVCGPDPMVLEIIRILKKFGARANTLLFEK